MDNKGTIAISEDVVHKRNALMLKAAALVNIEGHEYYSKYYGVYGIATKKGLWNPYISTEDRWELGCKLGVKIDFTSRTVTWRSEGHLISESFHDPESAGGALVMIGARVYDRRYGFQGEEHF